MSTDTKFLTYETMELDKTYTVYAYRTIRSFDPDSLIFDYDHKFYILYLTDEDGKKFIMVDRRGSIMQPGEVKFSLTKIKLLLDDGTFITTLQIKSGDPRYSKNIKVNL